MTRCFAWLMIGLHGVWREVGALQDTEVAPLISGGGREGQMETEGPGSLQVGDVRRDMVVERLNHIVHFVVDRISGSNLYSLFLYVRRTRASAKPEVHYSNQSSTRGSVVR